MELAQNQAFSALLTSIRQCPDFPQSLSNSYSDLHVRIYRVEQLTADNIQEMYECLRKKFYLKRIRKCEEYWYQNELRIFVWLLIGYLHVHQRRLEHLQSADWLLFSRIFNHKPPVFFHFQSRMLMKPQGRTAQWAQDETQILLAVMKQKGSHHKWNSMARELFVMSGGRYFRSAKQCRERWMNHLDPTKIHTNWTPSQDLVLLESIRQQGTRWSVAVKCLNHTRTQHMVKNRYKSLMAMESRRYRNKSGAEVVELLIKKLQKAIDKMKRQEQYIEEGMQEQEEESIQEPIQKDEKSKKSIEKIEGIEEFFSKGDEPAADIFLGSGMMVNKSPLLVWGDSHNQSQVFQKLIQEGLGNDQLDEEREEAQPFFKL